MAKENAIIAIYDTHTHAEDTIKELERSGLDMKKLSILGKGYHCDEHPVGFYTTGDRIKMWGGIGTFWGGLWGPLFEAAFFWIPGIGPTAAAGPSCIYLPTRSKQRHLWADFPPWEQRS
jgi:hypothetical protein